MSPSAYKLRNGFTVKIIVHVQTRSSADAEEPRDAPQMRNIAREKLAKGNDLQ